jgi:uncharacterized protein YbbC (DUF1343 family)
MMTLTGIDVLQRDAYQLLRGRRVGLITNHTGLNQDGVATADLLRAAPGVELKALFGPEHGIRGALDAKVPDSVDEATRLPVFSLYGARTRPTPEQLAGLDTLVFDIQDIGCRFYTYISTLHYCLETAVQHQLRFVVLDRPNPIGGVAVEGPITDADKLSFTACHPIPVRHGLTVGELARLFAAETDMSMRMEIVKAEGWKRTDLWHATGLTWVNPSPNMRSLTQALLYPGIGLLEFTNVSVGRGTDTPFEVLGAPWMDGRKLAAELNARKLPGVRFVPIRYTPKSSVHANRLCGGINHIITDWKTFAPLRTGLTIAETLRKLFPKDWEPKRYITLLAHAATYEALLRGESAERLVTSWQPQVEAFRERRKPYLLYT